MTRVTICAVGRVRSGPEKTLIADYAQRFDRTGRALGLGPLKFIEVEDKKNAGMAAEAKLLRNALPSGAVLVTLDERGKLLSSPAFSQKLAGWRDGAGFVVVLEVDFAGLWILTEWVDQVAELCAWWGLPKDAQDAGQSDCAGVGECVVLEVEVAGELAAEDAIFFA